MKDAELSRLNKYIEKDDYPDTAIKKWKENGFLEEEDGKWIVTKKLPDISELAPEEFDELYAQMYEIFQRMSKSQKTFQYNDKATKFLNEFFGEGKVFEPVSVPKSIEDKTKKFVELILTDETLKTQFVNRKNTKIFNSILNGKKSLGDPDVMDLLDDTIKQFNYERTYNREELGKDDKGQELLRKMDSVELDPVVDFIRQETKPTAESKRIFKEKYSEIFSKLYKEKDSFDTFKKFDSEQVIINVEITQSL